MTDVPSLSIVIPVYNEPVWISVAVADAARAVATSPFAGRTELVLVDDGSDAETREALDALDVDLPLRILHQRNAGRLRARETGVRAAEHELVLLLDARVTLHPDGLGYVAAELEAGANPVWNAHVDMQVGGNPYARFWRTITHVAWRDYLDAPRRVSFGIDEYDRYPKGTTCFLAPRASLLAAIKAFTSHYGDPRHANDDTVLIRSIAAEQPINISPGFRCLYRSRDSLGRFIRHTFHRGTVFFDGFARPGTRFYIPLLLFFPASLSSAAAAAARPRLALYGAVALPAATAAAALGLRRPPRDAAAVASLILPFGLAYGAGIWRGALMSLRDRARGGDR